MGLYSVSISLDEAREIVKKQKNKDKEKDAPVYFEELVLYMGARRVISAYERGEKIPDQEFYYPVDPSLKIYSRFTERFRKRIKNLGISKENTMHIKMFSGISKFFNKK